MKKNHLNSTLSIIYIHRKMGELQSVVELYVEVRDWEEAFAWAEKHPEFRQIVYVPYATYLAEQDKFLQAQKGKYMPHSTQRVCSTSYLPKF